MKNTPLPPHTLRVRFLVSPRHRKSPKAPNQNRHTKTIKSVHPQQGCAHVYNAHMDCGALRHMCSFSHAVFCIDNSDEASVPARGLMMNSKPSELFHLCTCWYGCSCHKTIHMAAANTANAFLARCTCELAMDPMCRMRFGDCTDRLGTHNFIVRPCTYIMTAAAGDAVRMHPSRLLRHGSFA